MPLTKPTEFDNNCEVTGERLDAVVSISDGTSTWYFSRRPIPGGLGTTPVYPLLLQHSDIVDAMDWIGKSVRAADVTVTISNVEHYPSSGGTAIRMSELLADVMAGELKIYFIAGDTAAALSDCLLVFSGYVTDAPEYDSKTINIRAASKGKLINRKLPLLTVQDKWGAAPSPSLSLPLPIVYGTWDKPDLFGDDSDGTGLFRGVIVEDDQTPLYVISEHEMDDVDSAYAHLGEELVGLKYVSDAYSAAQGSYVAVDITLTYTDFPLKAALPGVYDIEDYVADDPENAYDNNPATDATINDNYNDTGSILYGTGTWGINNEVAFRRYLLTGECSIKIGYKQLVRHEYPDTSAENYAGRLYHYGSGVADYVAVFGESTMGDITFGSDTLYFFDYDPTLGHYVTSADLNATLNDDWVLAINNNQTTSWADGTEDNQWLCTIGELVLRLDFDLEQGERFCWSTGTGKKFGAWVDAGGRDNGFDSGDVIDDPAMIIEDIARSYLALETADIDTDSFDDAINTDVDMRVNVFESTDALKLIQEISEQSTFAVFYSAAGKLTAVPLNDSTPSVDETIRVDQIADYHIQVSKTSDIINKLIIKSRFKAHNNEFYDTDIFWDYYSQSDLDSDRSATYEWKYLVADSVDEVAAVYVADEVGIWSQQHIKIEFAVPGYMMSHLQPGDWINLHQDADNICKPYGGSWDSRNLLVLEARKSMAGTTIKAMELYATEEAVSPPSEDGLYEYQISGSPGDDITLSANAKMTDDDYNTEIGSEDGYIVIQDHYGMDFTVGETISTSIWTFRVRTDRAIYALTAGACNIYYSDDNDEWTQLGTSRTYLNGGIYDLAIGANPGPPIIFILADGSPTDHRYWKFTVTQTFGDGSGTFGMTELEVNVV